MKICVIIIIFYFCFVSCEKIRFVFSLFRHGARSPYKNIDKDNKDIFNVTWKGESELTGVGKRQHFLIGYKNRLKYIDKYKLLGDTFDPREIMIYSTPRNRTIESALAQMQGLYPPGTGFTLTQSQISNAIPPISDTSSYEHEIQLLSNYSLPGQMSLIPIYIFYYPENFMQLYDEKLCKGLEGMGKRNQERKEVKEFLIYLNETYGDKLLSLISKDKGFGKGFWLNYKQSFAVLDTIISEYWEGVNMDKIIAALELPNITAILNDAYKLMFYDLTGNGINNDYDACIFGMSPIFRRIIEYMDYKIKMDSLDYNYLNYDLPKLLLFSGHDNSVGAFMGFMKIVFNTKIKYTYFASNVNLELFINEDNKYMIRYLFNDEIFGEFNYSLII